MNDTAKTRVANSTVEVHYVFFPKTKIRIPLYLHGVFSYFPTRNTTIKDLLKGEKVIITQEGSTWNPHSEHFGLNEDSYLDLEWRNGLKMFAKENGVPLTTF